jgi:hypothetical protein
MNLMQKILTLTDLHLNTIEFLLKPWPHPLLRLWFSQTFYPETNISKYLLLFSKILRNNLLISSTKVLFIPQSLYTNQCLCFLSMVWVMGWVNEWTHKQSLLESKKIDENEIYYYLSLTRKDWNRDICDWDSRFILSFKWFLDFTNRLVIWKLTENKVLGII